MSSSSYSPHGIPYTLRISIKSHILLPVNSAAFSKVITLVVNKPTTADNVSLSLTVSPPFSIYK